MSRFVHDVDFSSLSTRDLLEARDHYHYHLANLENVVGTAIGRYRIRYTDPDYNDPHASKDDGDDTPRTLANSGVLPWSWPCVLVFVSTWRSKAQLSGRPAQYVPPRLYLPDGRVAPTCVVHAPLDLAGAAPPQLIGFPSGLTGGGYPLLTEDQGQERIGSIGCMVTDGSYVYALTSDHVVGREGSSAYTLVRGERVEIAKSYTKTSRKVPLQDIYPKWPGLRSLINVDAGLLRVNDVSQFTAQVYGIGEMGQLIDVNVDTLTLDLIGTPVRANGAASGQLRGEIQGLFYRYRSVGGFDYVAELLIGPRHGDPSVTTRPGDSGTVWFWDEQADAQHAEAKRRAGAVAPETTDSEEGAPARRRRAPQLRPIALQWGGQAFLNGGSQEQTQFALASCLSTVCRELDVELVRNWNLGHSEYWGKVGHYKVAALACLLATNPNLDQLLRANAETISISDQDISDGTMPAGGTAHFVALADVADLVWRTTRGKDKANHFADMDEPGPDGKTLMDLWKAKTSSRTPAEWTKFYDSLETMKNPPKKILDRHRGALPFRVKQMYEAMVDAVKAGEVVDFVAIAGLMGHYVGDACQPLHVSRLHHGEPDDSTDDAVHSDYETGMLDAFAPEVVAKTSAAIGARKVSDKITGGDDAANCVVKLMEWTINHLSPQVVFDTWKATKGPHHTADMWAELGDATCASLAEGALTLATLWQSAWLEGKGDQTIPETDLKAANKNSLRSRYNKKSFVESNWLRDM